MKSQSPSDQVPKRGFKERESNSVVINSVPMDNMKCCLTTYQKDLIARTLVMMLQKTYNSHLISDMRE